MFPEKGTPVGFGYVAICKDPQIYIDKLSANIMENAMMTTKKRFFVSSNTGVNEEEFKDWTKPLVHVQGELDDKRIQEIVTQPLSSIYVDIINMKVEEMKDTAANRDVNSGSAGSGVTAAAAIAALQEAGNKASRDMIAASYRTHVRSTPCALSSCGNFTTRPALSGSPAAPRGSTILLTSTIPPSGTSFSQRPIPGRSPSTGGPFST